MELPANLGFEIAKRQLRLIFADDAGEIARLEAEVGQSQVEAVAWYIPECYEFRHVRSASFEIQRDSLRHELKRMSPAGLAPDI